jgi:hypothetical protein
MALTSWACMETCRSLSALPAKPLPMPQCSNPCSWPAGPRGDSIPRHSPPDWFLRQHWWLIQGMDTVVIHKSTTHPCLLRPFLIPTNLQIRLLNRYIVTAKSQTASTKVSEPKSIRVCLSILPPLFVSLQLYVATPYEIMPWICDHC